MEIYKNLEYLEYLDFTGKGEAFVENKFITPLLEYLGYDFHKDYEVKRHGDDDTSFKLQYPAVDRGAKTIRNFNPDYMPTIRKKCFWIIEAKSAKDVIYPFDGKFIVQGLQYCIHPEIRAKYLVLTNGLHTCIYDSFMRIYGNGNIYEPIFEFTHKEISSKWKEIFQLLSIEKIREFVEDDILSMYEKVVSSSLDEKYPFSILRRIETISVEASKIIKKHVSELTIENFMSALRNHQEELALMSSNNLYSQMDFPLISTKSIGEHFAEKGISMGIDEIELYKKISSDFNRQSIFRKENSIAALCTLFHHAIFSSTKDQIIGFLQEHKDFDLPLLNQVECAFIRVNRKRLVVAVYPEKREKIHNDLEVTPEISRFINPPTVLSTTYIDEIMVDIEFYKNILDYSDQKLTDLLADLTVIEKTINEQYEFAKKNLGANEKEFCGGLEICGLYYKAAFDNIMRNILADNYSLID